MTTKEIEDHMKNHVGTPRRWVLGEQGENELNQTTENNEKKEIKK